MSVVTVDEVLRLLDHGHVRATRRGWSARCPGHQDRSPSLSILRGHDGRALLRCWAGCTREEILRALGLDDGRPLCPKRWESPLDRMRHEAIEIARGQAWYREETRLMYQISDAIRARYRAVRVAREIATSVGNRPEAWKLLATAAVVERQAQMIEAQLDEAIA